MMAKRRRFTLSERINIIKTMGSPENLKSNGVPNFYNLSKPVDEGGLGIDRKTLKKWWKERDNDKTDFVLITAFKRAFILKWSKN